MVRTRSVLVIVLITLGLLAAHGSNAEESRGGLLVPIDTEGHPIIHPIEADSGAVSIQEVELARQQVAYDSFYNNPASRLYAKKGNDYYPVEGRAYIGRELVSFGQRSWDRGPRIAGLPGENLMHETHGAVIQNHKRVNASSTLLPAPRRANELFYSYIYLEPGRQSKTRLGDATNLAQYGIGQSIFDDVAPDARLEVTPALGAFYDTGSPMTQYSVATLPLGPRATDGQTSFFSSSNEFVDNPFVLAGDLQVGGDDGIEKTQVYYEVDNIRDTTRPEAVHLYGRMLVRERTTLLAGMTTSLFHTQGYSVTSLNDQSIGLVGSGKFADETDNTVQLRIQHRIETSWGARQWGLAIEDPFEGDFMLPGVTELTRWPTVAANYVVEGKHPEERLALAAIMRNLGGELGTGEEQFETGWGLSAYGTRVLHSCRRRLGTATFGVAGGNGIGQYVNGVSNSVVLDSGTGSLVALDGFGAFAGLSHHWFREGRQRWSANLAFGYASMETPDFVGAETNRTLKQVFANVMYYPKESVGLGLEYQFGRRETRAGGAGENNRIMFVLAFTTRPTPAERYARFEDEREFAVYHRDIVPASSGGSISNHAL